jgi:hypothetical protein
MAKKKSYQPDLFASSSETVRKVITFASMSIDQKINYKANECGLHCVYLSRYNYFCKPLFQPVVSTLTSTYHWHHRVNSGAENRLTKKTTLF